MNVELERIFRYLIEVRSRNLPEGTEEYHHKLPSGQSMSLTRFEQRIFRIKIQKFAARLNYSVEHPSCKLIFLFLEYIFFTLYSHHHYRLENYCLLRHVVMQSLDIYQRFGEIFAFYLQEKFFYAEYGAARLLRNVCKYPHIPEDSNLHSDDIGDFKSRIFILFAFLSK